jgi:hypothetical protein
MKKMSRETQLSYNTVKKYLERMDAEASGEGDGGPNLVRSSGSVADAAGRRT